MKLTPPILKTLKVLDMCVYVWGGGEGVNEGMTWLHNCFVFEERERERKRHWIMCVCLFSHLLFMDGATTFILKILFWWVEYYFRVSLFSLQNCGFWMTQKFKISQKF